MLHIAMRRAPSHGAKSSRSNGSYLPRTAQARHHAAGWGSPVTVCRSRCRIYIAKGLSKGKRQRQSRVRAPPPAPAPGTPPAFTQNRSASTYFHRRVTHLTALQVLRLGAWSAVMPVHHKVRATTSEGPARPPEGSLFAATAERQRRLTMSRHRRRDASTPGAAKSDHMYHPSMKVSTSPISSPSTVPSAPALCRRRLFCVPWRVFCGASSPRRRVRARP